MDKNLHGLSVAGTEPVEAGENCNERTYILCMHAEMYDENNGCQDPTKWKHRKKAQRPENDRGRAWRSRRDMQRKNDEKVSNIQMKLTNVGFQGPAKWKHREKA